jgi:cobalt-zinc-cadmium efflux system outer membrane protein
MRTCVVCAALLVAGHPAVAPAQTVSLSESEVLAQLGPGTPRILAARAAVDVARADVLAAGRWPNPTVTFNREAVAGVTENIVTVAQPLPVTGRRRFEVAAATARVDATASRAEEQIRRLRAEARLAFTALWAAQARERELARRHQRLSELAGILGKREAAGDAAGFDRLRAERDVADADAGRGLAASDRAQAQAILAGFLLTSREGTLEAVRPGVPDSMIPTTDELMATADRTRGDLLALAREADAARFAGEAAARRALPEPEVVAGTKTSSSGGGDVGSIVGIHVAIPLFDRARPERTAARAREQQARAEAEALRRTIRASIDGWRAAVIERRRLAASHRATLADGTDEIERIAQVSYEAGERGIFELLDAYGVASAARVRQVELDASVRAAEIELEFVSGWEMP